MRCVNIPMEELIKLIQEQLDSGAAATLRVTGSSMHPMLRSRRDTVTLVPAQRSLQKTDVILYRRDNGQYVLHRIVKAEAGLTCCGDNQWQPERVEPSQVIAVVSAFTRGKKTYGVTDMGYRLYARIWTELFPVRRPLIALRRALGRLRKKCK